MRKSNFFIFLFLIIFLSYFIYINSKGSDRIDNSIYLSVDWYKNVQREDGLFGYNFHTKNNTFNSQNNIIRQIGTFYSMIKLYDYTRDDSLKDGIYNFKREIDTYLRYDNFDGEDVAYLEFGRLSKINSNSLYLLSLVEMHKVGLELEDKDYIIMKKVVSGMIYYEREEGGFWYLYYAPRNHEKNVIDWYGSGEALFALISYYKYVDSSREDLLILTNNNFEKFYPQIDTYPYFYRYNSFFLWGLLYLNEVYEINYDLSSRLYIDNMILKALEYRKENNICRDEGCIVNFGAGEYAYFEGISSIYDTLEDDSLLFEEERLDDYFLKAKDFILSMQITSLDDYYNQTGEEFKGDKNYLIGGFCNDIFCENIRIDYTQHAICSLLSIKQ